MSGALAIESTARGDVTYVRLIGDLDESFDASELLQSAAGDALVLDFGDVATVNSGGVQRWKEAIPELQKKVKRLIFVECSAAVVSELNADAAFLGGGELVSVRAPFRCEVCDSDMEVTIDADAAATDTVPTAACETCSADMVLDEDGTTYFDFTNKVPPASVEPALRQTIDELTTMAEAPSDLPEEPSQMQSGELTDPKQRIDLHEPTVEARAPALPSDPDLETEDDEERDELLNSFDEPTGELARERRAQAAAVADARALPIDPALEPTRVRHEETDPAVKKGRRGPRQSFGDAITGLTRRLRKRRAPALVVAIVVAAVIVGVGVMFKATGIPEGALLAFHRHLEKGEFKRAEEALEQLRPAMSDELASFYVEEIESAKGNAAIRGGRRAQELFDQRKFQKALEQASRALELGGDSADILFVAAESARRAQKPNRSAEYYERFIEKYPKDRRFDDALFWLGETEFARGNIDKARALFARVIAAPKSNYKRSATRRLQEMEGK